MFLEKCGGNDIAINSVNADETSNELVSVKTENDERWSNPSFTLKRCLDTSHLVSVHPVQGSWIPLVDGCGPGTRPRNGITRSAGTDRFPLPLR